MVIIYRLKASSGDCILPNVLHFLKHNCCYIKNLLWSACIGHVTLSVLQHVSAILVYRFLSSSMEVSILSPNSCLCMFNVALPVQDVVTQTLIFCALSIYTL